MATIDQLLNDIDEFENWPLDIENAAGDDASGSVDENASTQTDLVDHVLRSNPAKYSSSLRYSRPTRRW